MKNKCPVIETVVPGSIAEELEIEKGDTLLSINSVIPEDLIAYRYLTADDYLELEIMKPDGESWVCEIEKEPDEDLGLGFVQDTFDGIRRCGNKCVFCFVDQMPQGLRESLYIKDDDYRMSFLHGNFVTLTNISKKELDRILTLRLSPLYISIHATDPQVREGMVGSKKAKNIMEQLKALSGAGIEMHTQIVLCPGLNDGDVLKKTLSDLGSLTPAVQSIAIVPVGLTRFRESLYPLRKFTSEEAGNIIQFIQRVQDDFMKKVGCPLVYLADEFYVMAKKPVPPDEMYCDYPQLENGIGMVRLFYDSFDAHEKKMPAHIPVRRKAAVVTGSSGAYVLEPLVQRLNQIENLEVRIVPVINRFFGEGVTVAGLLTGQDILAEMEITSDFDLILLPSVMFKNGTDLFIDGMTATELAQALGKEVRIADLNTGAVDFIEKILMI